MPQTFYTRSGKRIFDVILSSALLLLLSPLFLLLALAVRLDSKGPVFYRQERMGRDGQSFFLRKFRSMVVGAEKKGAGILVEAADPRITRVGRFLRKVSLDELPQLLNVLGGSMSIVGPRPGLRYQVEQYDAEQRRRLLLRPGITGWAQIHGRNAIDWEQRIAFDLEYLRRCSFKTDLYVLLRTPAVILGGEDQIASADYWKEKKKEKSNNPPTDNISNG